MAKTVYGRTARSDPAQEQLISKKDRLNERIKQLIYLLIETKKAYNGRPSAGLGLTERGDIKYPLPDPVNQAASAIDQQADQVVSELQDIINDQYQYSQRRRKGRSEMPVAVAFDKNASAISRTLTHLLTPFKFNDKDRWVRLRMLRASAKINEYLREVETNLVKRSRNSIPNTVYTTKDIFHMLKTSFDPMWKPLWESLQEIQRQEKMQSEEEKAAIRERKREEAAEERARKRDEQAEDRDKKRKEKAEERAVVRNERAEERAGNQALQEAKISGVVSPDDIVNVYGDKVEYDGQQTIELGQNSSLALTKSLSLISEFLMRARHAVPKDDSGLKTAIDNLNLFISNAKIERNINNRFEIYLKQIYPLFINIKDTLTHKVIQSEHYDEKLLALAAATKPERWLRRKLLETFPTRDSVLRVSAAEYVSKARSELKTFMKELETFHNTPMDLLSSVGPFLSALGSALDKISKLADMHNNDAKTERYKLRDEGEKFRVEIISGKDINDLKGFSRFLTGTSEALDKLFSTVREPVEDSDD